MTPERVRAAAKQLDVFHERFIGFFGRVETRRHSRVSLRGLLLHDRRKTCESMALRFAEREDDELPGRREVTALQHFLTQSPWDHHPVMAEIQAVFAEEFAPSAAPSPIGVVGVIDESGDEKSGTHSCGAGTQWLGRVGKTEVCQVGVFLAGVTPAGTALLDHELFLPKDWAGDRQRRRKARVPKEVKFRTKIQIALDLIRRTLANGHVTFDWITADSLYGKNGEFLSGLESLDLRYVAETACDTVFWTKDPATQIPAYSGSGPRPTNPHRGSVRSAKAIAADLPAEAWQPVKLREGSKGPVVSEFARVRVWGVRHGKAHAPMWLVFRRELGGRDVSYYVSNAAEEVPLETLALVIAARWRVEELFEDSKEYLGLADCESRGWSSWHHHTTLVALAHLYVLQVRQTLRAESSELTFDRAYHLVRDALSRPRLTSEESLHLSDYYLRQNAIATKSHRKSWIANHKETAEKLRL